MKTPGTGRLTEHHEEPAMPIAQRVRLHDLTVLSDNWYVLRKARFELQRSDGRWQMQEREAYDRGNGVAILLYDPVRRRVVLTRQFRYPAFANGHDDLLIEVPAGLLDDASPEDRIRAEVEEETGFRVSEVRKVFEAFMSPGSVTERLHFYVSTYNGDSRMGQGGGIESEGEDIEVFEPTFDEALAMIEQGEIRDAKTIMLLQYAALHLFPRPA
jgi:nudix-type nucleoside diphosphatase (YffH/AdpP family)